MKPRWVVARKEFAGVFTERTILLAVVIQVFVAGFSSFLVVGLSALVDPSAFPGQLQPQLATGPETGNDTLLMQHLSSQGIQVRRQESDAAAYTLFKNGLAQGALFLAPPSPNQTAEESVRRVTLILPDGDFRTTLTIGQVKKALEGYERDLRAQRLERLEFQPLHVGGTESGGSFAFVYSLLIPLLVFLPVVLSGALCADSLTEEVQRKTLPLLLVSPATPADVVEGKLLANTALAPLLSLAWFGLLSLNDLTVPPLGILAILLMGTSLAFLLGLLACVIALATRDRNKAHLFYAASMVLLLGLSFALPSSPVNTVALFAAGSETTASWFVVAGFCGAALAGAVLLRVFLRRTAAWMAAGTSS